MTNFSGQIITLNQHTDTPARVEYFDTVRLTYLYDRSRDSRNGNASGQDFIAFTSTENRITFALCDGVSQSFFGDLSARFLGEKLTAWLRDLPFPPNEEVFATLLSDALQSWQPEAAELVEQQPINPTLPPIVRDALDRKREYGSETMFVAGMIDIAAKVLYACYFGDMHLYLFDASNARFALPNATLDTRERWSSKTGIRNGTPHTAIVPLTDDLRIVAHSDGILSRADALARLTPELLNNLARDLASAPASDDISVLEIAFVPSPASDAPLETPKLRQPSPHEAVITWDVVPHAAWYRANLEVGKHRFTVDVDSPTLFLPVRGLVGEHSVRVCAMSESGSHSAWSEPITLTVTDQATPISSTPKPITVRKPDSRPIQVPKPDDLQSESVPAAAARLPRRSNAINAGLMNALALVIAVGIALAWFFLNF